MMKPLLLAFFFAAPLTAGAHAFGVSHETVVDGMHIDIGYSSAAPVVGESVIFDFNLPVDEEVKKYTNVWVRIDGEDGSTKLATAVYNASFGGPRMSYVFGDAGTYTISVRYENEGDAIVKTEWPLTVLPWRMGVVESLQSLPWLLWLAVGAVLGAGAFIVRPYFKRA
jgi:hypothetical protein